MCKNKNALHAESAFCIKGEKFRGTTFVSHFVTAAAKGNSCLLNADQTGILTLCCVRIAGFVSKHSVFQT